MADELSLPERVVALDQALARGHVPHAFGGALSLAYWTRDPRGTSDIDVNVFLPASDPGAALDALPTGVEKPDGTAATIAADGQIRLWWGRTPVDLFFDYVELHEAAARNSRLVVFADTQIPILGPVELATFKVMFDRTRDWADIEAMLEAGSLDPDDVRERLIDLVDANDPRLSRLDDAVRRAQAA